MAEDAKTKTKFDHVLQYQRQLGTETIGFSIGFNDPSKVGEVVDQIAKATQSRKDAFDQEVDKAVKAQEAKAAKLAEKK